MVAQPSDPDIPRENGNLRQSGARKLEARPGEKAGLPAGFGESGADLERGSTHLFEPVDATQEKTRSAEGQQSPRNVGIEGDPAKGG